MTDDEKKRANNLGAVFHGVMALHPRADAFWGHRLDLERSKMNKVGAVYLRFPAFFTGVESIFSAEKWLISALRGKLTVGHAMVEVFVLDEKRQGRMEEPQKNAQKR